MEFCFIWKLSTLTEILFPTDYTTEKPLRALKLSYPFIYLFQKVILLNTHTMFVYYYLDQIMPKYDFLFMRIIMEYKSEYIKLVV